MTIPVIWIGEDSGDDIYAVRRRGSQRWNTSGTPNWETMTVANWADYGLVASEIPMSSKQYTIELPVLGGNNVEGWEWLDWYKQADPMSRSLADDTLIGQMLGYFDGTTFRINEADIQAECEAAIDEKGHLLQSEDTGATAVARPGDDVGDVLGKVLGGGSGTIAGVGAQVDLQTIKAQAVTCNAGVIISPAVGQDEKIIVVAGMINTHVVTVAIDAITDNAISAGAVAKIQNGIQDTDTPGTGTLLSRIVGTLAAGTHQPQTGDTYAVVNSGTHGNAALKTLIDTVDAVADRIIVSVAGTVSGARSGTEVFEYDGLRMTSVNDGHGNRTSVTFEAIE